MVIIISIVVWSLLIGCIVVGKFFGEKANARFFEKEERSLLDRPWHAVSQTDVSWIRITMISVYLPFLFLGLYHAHKKFKKEKIRTFSNGRKSICAGCVMLTGMGVWLWIAHTMIRIESEKDKPGSPMILKAVMTVCIASLLITAVYCLVRGALQYRAGKEMLRCLRAVNDLPEKKISLIAKDLDRSTEETVALLHKLVAYTYLPPDTEIDVENDRLKPGKPISKQLAKEAKKMLRNK